MRVIAGTRRRLLLNSVKGDKVRPTSDLMKETLFNIIGSKIESIKFLDLFAGTGGISIEALSRGAKHATLVENYRLAINCIKENLLSTNLIDSADIIAGDVFTALKRLKSKYDIIFMDPPYNKGYTKKVLYLISQLDILEEDGLIIVEEDSKLELDDIIPDGYECIRVRKYGQGMHLFLKNCFDKETLS